MDEESRGINRIRLEFKGVLVAVACIMIGGINRIRLEFKDYYANRPEGRDKGY